MKLEEEVLKQVQLRESALASAKYLVQMASNEYKQFVKSELMKLGVDEKKKYELDVKTGEVLEVKLEKVEVEEAPAPVENHFV